MATSAGMTLISGASTFLQKQEALQEQLKSVLAVVQQQVTALQQQQAVVLQQQLNAQRHAQRQQQLNAQLEGLVSQLQSGEAPTKRAVHRQSSSSSKKRSRLSQQDGHQGDAAATAARKRAKRSRDAKGRRRLAAGRESLRQWLHDRCTIVAWQKTTGRKHSSFPEPKDRLRKTAAWTDYAAFCDKRGLVKLCQRGPNSFRWQLPQMAGVQLGKDVVGEWWNIRLNRASTK